MMGPFIVSDCRGCSVMFSMSYANIFEWVVHSLKWILALHWLFVFDLDFVSHLGTVNVTFESKKPPGPTASVSSLCSFVASCSGSATLDSPTGLLFLTWMLLMWLLGAKAFRYLAGTLQASRMWLHTFFNSENFSVMMLFTINSSWFFFFLVL